MSWRARLTRMLLWISVLAWGILLGGKLFDLLVLADAWSASPPESLSLMPYGPRFPVDTGQFFFPCAVALLVCSFAVLIAGWKTPASYRVWLVLPAVMITVNLLFTVSWFWPHNRGVVARGHWRPGRSTRPRRNHANGEPVGKLRLVAGRDGGRGVRVVGAGDRRSLPCCAGFPGG